MRQPTTKALTYWLLWTCTSFERSLTPYAFPLAFPFCSAVTICYSKSKPHGIFLSLFLRLAKPLHTLPGTLYFPGTTTVFTGNVVGEHWRSLVASQPDAPVAFPEVLVSRTIALYPSVDPSTYKLPGPTSKHLATLVTALGLTYQWYHAAMVSDLGSFKLILCPKGIECPHKDCLFKHPDEDNDGVRKCLSKGPVQERHAVAEDSVLDTDEGPRKRQKTSGWAAHFNMKQTAPAPPSPSAALGQKSFAVAHSAGETHKPDRNPPGLQHKPLLSIAPDQSPPYNPTSLTQWELPYEPELLCDTEAAYDPASPAFVGQPSEAYFSSQHTPSQESMTIVPSQRRGAASENDTTSSETQHREEQGTSTYLKHRMSSPDPPPTRLKKQVTAVSSALVSPPSPPYDAITRSATPQSTSISSPTTPSTSKSDTACRPTSTITLVLQSMTSQVKRSPKARESEHLNPRQVALAPEPHATRLKLLQLYHAELVRLNTKVKDTAADETKKLALSDQELVWFSLDEEEAITRKGKIYKNVLKNRIVELKRMKGSKFVEKLKIYQAQHGTRSHMHTGITKEDGLDESIRASNDPAKNVHDKVCPSIDQNKGNIYETNLGRLEATKALLENIEKYLTPIDNYSAHGYIANIPDDAEVQKVKQGVEDSKGWETCDRCKQRFQVFPGRHEETGALTSGGKCTFHPGKTYYSKQAVRGHGDGVKLFKCCGETIGDSAGCYVHDCHVFKASDPKRLSTVLAFTETPENPHVSEKLAFSFDCEMGYTTHGMELIRLTVIQWPGGETALDILVQPKGEILDLNSRYSGIFPKDMADAERWTGSTPPRVETTNAGVKTGSNKGLKLVSSPEAARNLFYSLINRDTILIGHALENDLNACRMIHPKLIDTVLLFPHPRGLPFRRGLKALANERLGRSIQRDDNGPGHDSAEDARAAGDLVRNKVLRECIKTLARE